MKNRRFVMVLSTFIVLTVMIGLGFQFGLFNGKPDFSSLQMYGTLSEIYLGVYFLCERIWMNHHHRGVFAAFWKYSAFISYLFGILIGWIFIYPFYTGMPSNVQTAFLILHGILPLEVIAEWGFGEKGHFQKQFRIFGVLPASVYVTAALILGAMKKGIGMNGAAYPYSFLNVKQLGYAIVIPTCLLYFLMLVIFETVMVEIDTSLAAAEKKRRRRYDSAHRT